jgi:nucleotide-binding universal stress UspA family protein
MKKILCPTDFSETADQAIAYAAKLCKKIGAELTLLNVQSIFSLPPKEVIKGKYLATKSIAEQLDDRSYEVMKVFKITCLSEVEPSNSRLSDVIAAKASSYDLVVMGTNGADDLYEFFLGSRSYQVVKKSNTPVLLLPTGCGYKDISTMVFAFDYQESHELPLTQLRKFTSLLESTITILQVKKRYVHEEEAESKEIRDGLKVIDNITGVNFETIYADDIGFGIHQYLVKNNIDALALCSIHQGMGLIESLFHKSVIKQLSATADYPIYVFHE